MSPQTHLRHIDRQNLIMGLIAYVVMFALGLFIFAVFGYVLPLFLLIILVGFHDMVIKALLRFFKKCEFDEEALGPDIEKVTQNILLSRGFNVRSDKSRFIVYLEQKTGRPPFITEAICQGEIINDFTESEKAIMMLALSPHGSWPAYGNLLLAYHVDKVSCQSAHDKIKGLRALDAYFKSILARKQEGQESVSS